MSQSLRDLQRALAGDIGFSSALEELSTSLFNGKLPAMWARLVGEPEVHPVSERVCGQAAARHTGPL